MNGREFVLGNHILVNPVQEVANFCVDSRSANATSLVAEADQALQEPAMVLRLSVNQGPSAVAVA
jgi:hypothetical protein